MPEDVALQASHLRRVFGRKKFVAVDDVSFTIKPGQIHALLGPNGAGKTTTVRMCASLLEPTSGHVTVGGMDVVAHPRQARRHIGLVLGGDLGFYGRATARDNLLFFADIQGVPGKDRKAAVARVLTTVKLSADADVAVRDFSRGMRQRLHLARAMLTTPTVLLLDEPTTGLDPDIALTVRDTIRNLANSGIGILLTSHSMPEVEELADTISVIGAGTIATTGSVADIAAYAGIASTTTFTTPARSSLTLDAVTVALGDDAQVKRRPSGGKWLYTIYWNAKTNEADRDQALARALGEKGCPDDLITRAASLEEAYLAFADRLAR